MATDEKCGTKPIPFGLRTRLYELKGAALAVWFAFYLHADAGGMAWPSLWTLEVETGYCRDWIIAAKEQLVTTGWLIPQTGQLRGAGGTFTSRRYRVVIPPSRTLSDTELVRSGESQIDSNQHKSEQITE